MGFPLASLSLKGAGGFALGVWLRSLVIAALAFAAVELGARHLFATALVLGAGAVYLGLELIRSVDAADRALAQFVSGLTAEGNERPTTSPRLQRLTAAVENAYDGLRRGRIKQQQRIDFAEALADNVQSALLVVDQAGTVIQANRAAYRLIGEAGGPLGRIQALGPDAAQRLLALASGGREIVRLADDRSVLASLSLFQAPGQAPFRLIALQSLSSDLDVVVLKSWQDLTRVLAHEMMNSLTPICSLSATIAAQVRRSEEEDLAPSGDVAQALEVIARRSAGLMNFVERYRKLAETPAAARAPLEMGKFVQGLDQLMAPLMREAGVDYGSQVDPADLILAADRDLLEQAVINLLKNSLDAVSGRPGAMIRLSCSLGDGDGQVAIAVEDNGPGLACEDAETAFVPFFTTKHGGSGIGLTLARQIALAHGGRLDHVRRAPTGAFFRLLLP